MATIDDAVWSAAKSEAVRQYMEELEKAKPLSVRLLGRGNLARILGDDNFVDSTILETQKPALYAVLSLLRVMKNASILYAASSYGLGMELIRAAGYENIRGIDLDQRAVDFCKSQGLSANVMDAARTNFPDGSFDMVVSRDFVAPGYLSYDKVITVLNEHHRVLKPGGFAVFTIMWPGTRENLPPQGAIFASDFRNSPMQDERVISLTVPPGTDVMLRDQVAPYFIHSYRKSLIGVAQSPSHTASQSSQSQ